MFSTCVGGRGKVRASRFSFSGYYPAIPTFTKKQFDSYKNDKKL